MSADKFASIGEYHASTANPLITKGFVRAPMALEAAEGHTLVDWRELGFFPLPTGREGGYATEADIITQTADGFDLNTLWAEMQAALNLHNATRSGLVSIMTYTVTDLIENVPVFNTAVFEEASEFGVPQSARPTQAMKQLAYDFKDYDIALRYTWKYLRDADVRQVNAAHEQVLEADNALVFRKVMEALWDNTDRSTIIKNTPYNVYPLYNADGDVPPVYKSSTFSGSHNHYMTSGAATIDSDDMEALYDNIAEHGYGLESGAVFVALMNKDLVKDVRLWKTGEENGDDGAGGGTATAHYDFIPAPNQPTMIVPNEAGLLGAQPPTTWNGLPVIGSYAGIFIIEEDYIPANYVMMLASGGSGGLRNPVGIREHAQAAFRGLRLLPGNQHNYPLVDSFYSRGFGTGVRQRGGAAIMQITANASYAVPTQYANNGVLR